MVNKKQRRTGYIPVKGGLGNQMFFFAFSLYLHQYNFSSVLVWYEYVFTKQHNGVELYKAFEICEDVRAKRKLDFFLIINKSILHRKMKLIIGRLLKMRYMFFYKYKQRSPYEFDNSVVNLKADKIVFDGFWQNYNFLDKIDTLLLQTFKFNLPNNFEQNIFLNKILSTNSISIHVRRGDYLKAEFSELNVIKSMEYFNNAVKYMETYVELPVFYIFTDDIIWSKRNFVGDKFVFVEGNKNEFAYLDMFLMTKCKHNIISNSTFSFWGAWLNENPSKIVVAPKLWTKDVLSIKLCPPKWIFLDL
jgi:hypothetical protein